tara:strand:- start:616 stop:798 length:183 start_codon:yes stop_codon:yes gene_type:complete
LNGFGISYVDVICWVELQSDIISTHGEIQRNELVQEDGILNPNSSVIISEQKNSKWTMKG